MRKIIGSLVMFVATFFVLSINLKSKPIFSHIYQYTAPLTKGLQNQLQGLVDKGLDGSKVVGRQIFNNSVPTAKSSISSKNEKAPADNLSGADRDKLDSLIKRLK